MTEQMNGPSTEGKYVDQIDPDDPEYVRQLQRPAEVKEDMRQMEERQRVSLIMKSRAFREELEQMIADQLCVGHHPASLLALQQITELILPSKGKSSVSTVGAGPVIHIADIRGVDSLNYTKGEKVMRNKTATLYRLLDILGWSYGFNGLATTRLSQDYEHFLVIPHGLLYSEVTASNLLKVDMRGEVLDPGTTVLGLNKKAFTLHAAIHAARPDIRCIIHIGNPSAVSVSVQNCGLLPLCTEAMSLGELSHYSWNGSLADQEEKDKLTRALGPSSKVMFLRSYGVVVGGESIDEAFLLAHNVMTAIDTQLKTIPVGLDNISMPSEETCKMAQDLAQSASVGDESGKKKWRRGELLFESYVRFLDNAGYRTGHVYREPVTRRQDRRERANSDVEIPPASVSGGAYYEDDFRSPLKHHIERQKKTFRTEWLNTPNAYKKEEIDEIGTPNPKKITKWVKEEDQPASPSVKVESAHQFVPPSGNPKELKEKYKEIRKEYYEDKIDPGPQSRILEGMTYEEARQLKDGHVSGTTDTMIVIGAASKGIIQRDHQHNAVVYKTVYAANPFDNMTEEEIAKYRADIEGKKSDGKADTQEEEPLSPGPDGRLISTEERMEQVRKGPNETTITTTVVTKQVKQQEQPPPQYLETSLDELTDNFKSDSDVVDQEPERSAKTKKAKDETKPKRSQSARLPTKKSKELVAELQQNLEKRSKDDTAIGSPTKSTSSAEGTVEETEHTSREGSPAKETSGHESPEKGSDKKKKKFHMPSFSSKKKEKEKKK